MYHSFERFMSGHVYNLLNVGTRFRPLSLELPQALFPIAGVPLLEHHIDACAAVRPSDRHSKATEGEEYI